MSKKTKTKKLTTDQKQKKKIANLYYQMRLLKEQLVIQVADAVHEWKKTANAMTNEAEEQRAQVLDLTEKLAEQFSLRYNAERDRDKAQEKVIDLERAVNRKNETIGEMRREIDGIKDQGFSKDRVISAYDNGLRQIIDIMNKWRPNTDGALSVERQYGRVEANLLALAQTAMPVQARVMGECDTAMHKRINHPDY